MAKKSLAQLEQHRLFSLKGRLARSISSVETAVKQERLSVSTRVNLQFALDHLEIAYKQFDKDVGWKR